MPVAETKLHRVLYFLRLIIDFFAFTSAFSINKVQVLVAFALVRAARVDALVELVRAVVQVIIHTLVNI